MYKKIKIKDEKGLTDALARVDELMELNPKQGSLEDVELIELVEKIKEYEEINWEINEPIEQE